MHLIVFTHRLATPRSVTIGSRHLALALAAVLAAVIIGAIGLYYMTFRYAAEVRLPILQDMVGHLKAEESGKNSEFMRQNLNAMAVKLGEMQAQLTRLDALGERVSGLAGLKPNEFRSAEIPGRGGALLPGMRTFTMDEFSRELESLSRGVENRVDLFNVVEAELFNARLKAKRLPTVLPVNADFNASGFGMRIDPISGQQALHEGIDFIAQTGTPIYAAAGGVVLASEWHHQFGQMIEIDHGGDIVTRYAHASAVYVKPGDLVKRGQKIAAVGSSGRSTGPHLHFEVRFKGIAQNPARFLMAATKPEDAHAEVKQPDLKASVPKAPEVKIASIAKPVETKTEKALAPPPSPAPAAAAAKPTKVAKAAAPPSAPVFAPPSRQESGIRMTVTPIYRDGPPTAAAAPAAPAPGLPANP
jgi:murein DD-endopeptidase MepM/ murein hydrolase activator NlpD